MIHTSAHAGPRQHVYPLVVGGLAGAAVFLALRASDASRDSIHPSAGLQKLRLGAASRENCNITLAASDDQYSYHEEMNPPDTCLLEMPAKWQPPSYLALRDDYAQPWTEEEQRMADRAAQKGVGELLEFFGSIDDDRIRGVGTNGANALIDQCFSSSHKPDIYRRACEEASRVLKVIAPNQLDSGGTPPTCTGMRKKTKMLAYAHYLHLKFPGDRELKQVRADLLQLVQGSFDACKDLDEFLDASDTDADASWDQDLDLDKPDALPWPTFRNYIHQQGLINLYSVPDFVFPDRDEVDRFVWRLWTFGGKFNYLNGTSEKVGYQWEDSRHAYQLTHIAYWPTGYGRHKMFLSEAKWVYNYIRNNFWKSVLHFQSDPDLFAEFVDILRNVGCTEDTDLMVRYGSRMFIEAFKSNGETFITSRKSDYSLIHGPWTAILAVDRKEWEPIVPGSHGYNFRKALERGEALELGLR